MLNPNQSINIFQSKQPTVEEPKLLNDFQLDINQIMQTVISLKYPLNNPAQKDSLKISSVLINSWEKLISIIKELRSSNSGWPSDIPATPENITPYVIEEAGEIFDILQSEYFVDNNPLELDQQINNYDLNISKEFLITITDIIPKLLWYIGRSSDDVMALLTGIKARITKNENEAKEGILRLVASLAIDTPNLNWSIDLVTQQLNQFDNHITEEYLINQHNISFYHPQIYSQKFVEKITRKIQQATPEITVFLNGVETEILSSESNWESGYLHLKFNLEFKEHQKNDHPSDLTNIKAEIQLLDIKAKEIYDLQKMNCSLNNLWEIILFMQNNYFDPEINLNENLINTDKCLLQIVDSACEVLQKVNQYQKLDNKLLNLGLSLSELSTILLCGLIEYSYDVATLIGGVRSRIIEPYSFWKTGILRLVPILSIETPLQKNIIDITNAQLIQSESFLLNLSSVIESQENDWLKHPILLEEALTNIRDKIYNISSLECRTWLDGVKINIRYLQPGRSGINKGMYSQWQPALAKINLVFCFYELSLTE